MSSGGKGDEHDRSGYLPPHELRALFNTVVDRGEAGGVPPTPGPSIVLSTPGLAGAALAPPPTAPAFAADDPQSFGIMLARMANEMFAASLVPVPTPESLTTGAGMSAPGSPAAASANVSNAIGAPVPDPLGLAVASQLAQSSNVAPPNIAGPSGSPSHESIVPFGGGTNSTGTPGEVRTPDLANIVAMTSNDPMALPVGLAPASTSSLASPSASSNTMPGGATSPAGATSGAMPAGASSGAVPVGAPSGAVPATSGSATSGAMPAGASTGASPTNLAAGFVPTLEAMPAPNTSGAASAVPGRPNGLGMPPSNVGSPGGMPGAPMSVAPAAPTLPMASSAEHAGNAALGRAGVPSIGGGAGITPPSSPTVAMPSGSDLQAVAGESSWGGVPTGVTQTTSVPAYSSTSPQPNVQSREVAAPPSIGAGRNPFETTSLDNWSPYGTVGAIPLVGDAAIFVEPVIAPEYQLPLIDGVSIDALPGYAPQGSQLQGGEPTITGGESLHHGERAIRQTAVPFDPYAVRRDFPILEERVHGGKRLVWLDNAATTQKPRAVIDRLTRFYEHENSNVHRAAHTLAARATDAFESARETTRKFLNAPSTSEILFVRGATEGINLIANTWGVKNVGEGDEILLTHLEHHANIVPWQMLAARVGAKLKVAPVDDRGDVILEEYEKLITPRTKLVSFTQVSNALGTITPAREMIEIAHRRGAIVLLDGAQAVSHLAVDVQALGCDFYVFSGHKVFAPTGIGAVYGRRELLDAMPPWQGGGNMIADVTFERTQYQPPPWRFEAGTGNIADAAGLGAALDYVMRIGMNVIDRYEHELLVYATEQLARVPGLTMIGTSATKAGVLSFVLDGQRTEDVGSALDKDGIAVRSGHHCAQPILRRFGLEASVRASLAFYNVCEDIDALVDALVRLQSARRSVG